MRGTIVEEEHNGDSGGVGEVAVTGGRKAWNGLSLDSSIDLALVLSRYSFAVSMSLLWPESGLHPSAVVAEMRRIAGISNGKVCARPILDEELLLRGIAYPGRSGVER